MPDSHSQEPIGGITLYLHLGQDTVVRTRDVIAIFDLENASISKGYVINVTLEMPKTFVVCSVDGKTVVYISQISSATLKKRTGFIDTLSNI